MATRTGGYEVLIGKDLLKELPRILECCAPAYRYALISDSNVEALYGSDLAAALGGEARCASFTFTAGEASKRRKTWGLLTDQMLEAGLGRDTAVLALGGGVTGDLAGFIAATFLRGVPCVQVPTSLLAMIDSSIGGKTGVDTSRGKNLVGAFHQPTAVVIDGATLTTLPDRHVRAGTAEAIKHAAIADPDYLDWIAEHRDAILERDVDTLLGLVQTSVEIKSKVVAEDETERGRRSALNFGHTVGHAIEAVSNFELLHGEAVAIGMIAETYLGICAGVTKEPTLERLHNAVEVLKLPVKAPLNLCTDSFIEVMELDKKNRLGDLRFTLLESVGRVRAAADGAWTHQMPRDAIFEALAHVS